MNENFGWYILAKQIADYTNSNYYDIMERTATDVLGIAVIIQAENKIYNKQKTTTY